MSLRATILLILVGTIWGASFLLIRVAIDEVQPLQIVFMRCFLGALVLLAVLRANGKLVFPSRQHLAPAALLAALGILAPFFLIAWAEREIDSGTAAILNGTMPLFTLIFATALLAEERLTAARVIGVILGLAGVVLLVGGEASALGSAGLVALGAMVLSSACYGLSAIGARVLVQRWSPLPLSTAMVSCAAVYSGLIFFTTGEPRLDITLEAWLAMIVLGVAGTGLAYAGYYMLINMVSSVRASFVAYVIPVVGVILGAAVLGEAVTWYTVAGGAVILAGVAIGTGALRLRGREHRVGIRAGRQSRPPEEAVVD